MKILLIGPDYFNYSDNMDAITAALSAFGHQVQMLKVKSFTNQCGYVIKKLHKLGVKFFLKNYEQVLNKEIVALAEESKPNLFISVNGSHIHPKTIYQLQKNDCKPVLLLIDSIQQQLKEMVYKESLQYYNKIFSFDPQDIPWLKQVYNLNCEYFCTMYNPAVYYPDDTVNKDIDISFVGSPTPERLRLLNHIALYCDKKNRKLVVCGNYWNKSYFWKKLDFSNKYGSLKKFVHNNIVSPKQAAALYRRSKICLNMHIKEHEGINVRTFDILGAKSFQLVDYKEKIKELLDIDKEIVVYNDAGELLDKIEFFLDDRESREVIAKNGYEKVKEKFTVEKVMQDILARI